MRARSGSFNLTLQLALTQPFRLDVASYSLTGAIAVGQISSLRGTTHCGSKTSAGVGFDIRLHFRGIHHVVSGIGVLQELRRWYGAEKLAHRLGG